MPYVHIRVAKNNYTAEQKLAVIRKVSQALTDEMGRPTNSINIVIDEVDPENWGFGHETIATLRARETDRV